MFSPLEARPPVAEINDRGKRERSGERGRREQTSTLREKIVTSTIIKRSFLTELTSIRFPFAYNSQSLVIRKRMNTYAIPTLPETPYILSESLSSGSSRRCLLFLRSSVARFAITIIRIIISRRKFRRRMVVFGREGATREKTPSRLEIFLWRLKRRL